MYSTTISINSSILYLINEYCSRFHIGKSKFIKHILNHAVKNYKFISHGLTRYQSKSDDEFWIKFHLNISDDECDKFLFVRFHLRISLSKLLLIGIILFFQKLGNETREKNDSYTSIIETKCKILIKEEKNFKKIIKKEIKLE